MVKQKVSLEIITPMFMGSSNPNEAELRAPSIKGVMRYFYRATMAEEIHSLRQKEFNLFGGVLETSAASRAKATIDIENSTLDIGTNIIGKYKLQWHYNKSAKKLEGSHKGIGYLFYSVANTKALKDVKFVSVENKFSVLFRGEHDIIEKYLATL